MIGNWKIYWNEYASDTYLYGSNVTFRKKDEVEFENSMLVPGAVIKEWYSKTNYNTQHIEPALPIIDGECSYRITVDMDLPQEQGILVRLVYYNKYEKEIGQLVLREKSGEFRCPLPTYSYRIQLIAAGAKSLVFHSMTIEEVE